jgi:hypothetical protein
MTLMEWIYADGWSVYILSILVADNTKKGYVINVLIHLLFSVP